MASLWTWREWPYLDPIFDLHSLSHRGLTQELIPEWIKRGHTDLDGAIESSAYGETPRGLFSYIADKLVLSSLDTFLDLGAGGGNLLVSASAYCTSFGLERNPQLVEAGRILLLKSGLPETNLILGDFLEQEWPHATKGFAATARYSENTLEGISRKLSSTDEMQRFAVLGRRLPEPPGWNLEQESEKLVCWNPGEEDILEIIQIWSKVL